MTRWLGCASPRYDKDFKSVAKEAVWFNFPEFKITETHNPVTSPVMVLCIGTVVLSVAMYLGWID